MFRNHGKFVFLETKTPNGVPSYESPGSGSIGKSILAASWLEDCLANHPGCRYQTDQCQRPPSRLIDVGDANGIRPPHLWSTGTAFVPYITLSHHWGTGEQIMLTKASLSDMSKTIDLASLSQTYQDAIAITRLLGLRYLWIDSLCIVQDSTVDWQTEAANMGDIFKFSFCTIAASSASSNSEGCFFDRGPSYAKLSVSKAAESAPQILSNVHSKKGYRKGRDRLRSDIIPPEESASKKTRLTTFESVLERRRSRLSTEIAGFGHDLNSSSLTYSNCRSAPTMSLANNAKSVGAEGCGTIAPEPTVQSISKKKYDHLGNTQSSSNDRDALAIPAKISINSNSERGNSTANSAVQPTVCHPAGKENAVFYIIPLQKDLWAHSVELSPLSKRAWVLQERLLSPRTLHYTKTQLFWECRESKACEISPHPYPKIRRNTFDHFEAPTYTYLESTHQLYGLDVEPLHRHWPKIIEKYTDTSMTKLEDKLVAISGLARQVYSITKDKYCAGIWRADLVTQLLWRLQRPQHEIDLPYRAPSWSWASTEGKVEFTENAHDIVSVLEIRSVQSIGVDGKLWSFGQIEYGSLRVRGAMRAAKRFYSHGQRYKLLLTDQLDEELDTNECDYYPDIVPQSLSENPMCLPVARLLSGASTGGDENEQRGFVAGLVIEPTGDYANEYRRLGYFRVAASAGSAWFGLGPGLPLWDVTLV